MLAKAFSGAVLGVDAYIVEVEVDISNGMRVNSLRKRVWFFLQAIALGAFDFLTLPGSRVPWRPVLERRFWPCALLGFIRRRLVQEKRKTPPA